MRGWTAENHLVTRSSLRRRADKKAHPGHDSYYELSAV
jgi:hypothetical protein